MLPECQKVRRRSIQQIPKNVFTLKTTNCCCLASYGSYKNLNEFSFITALK